MDKYNFFEGLDAFGKVEQNEKKEGKYFIKITEGFKTYAANCGILLDLILEAIPEKNLVIEQFNSDKNLFWLIIKPK